MNKEPKQTGNEESPTPKQPFTMRYATYIYAALALCVLTVLAISIISASTPPDIDVSIPEISIPSLIQDTSKPDVNHEKPVIGEESGIPGDTSEPPVVNEVKYVVPCAGKVQKGHSVAKPVFSETMQDYRIHSGIDIAAEKGAKVVAYSDGKIVSVTDDPLMGKTIVISHEGGLKSVYKNLSNTLPDSVKVGAVVKAGDVIGSVGDTSKIEAADASHLHFELLLDDKAIDAEKELKAINGK